MNFYMDCKVLEKMICEELPCYASKDGMEVKIEVKEEYKNNLRVRVVHVYCLRFDGKDFLNKESSIGFHMDKLFAKYIVLHPHTDEGKEDFFKDLVGAVRDGCMRIMQSERQSCALKNGGKMLLKYIVFQLVNWDANAEMLSNVPHRRWNDLAIIYTLIVGENRLSISNQMAESLKLSEETLYQLAYENTRKLFPVVIEDSAEVFGECEETLDEAERALLPPLYILCNEKRTYGAIGVLYKDTLEEVSDRHGGEDLYIIPSSIHEALLSPVSVMPLEALKYMVYDVNMSKVFPEERLSHQVYLYERASGNITALLEHTEPLVDESEVFL